MKLCITFLCLLCLTCQAQFRTDQFAQGVRGTAYDLTQDLWHFWNPGGGYNTNDIGSIPQNVTLGTGLTSTTNGWEMGTTDAKYATINGPISNGTKP